MPKIAIADEEMQAKLKALEVRSPVIFEEELTNWLKDGGDKIKLESLKIASKEAAGATHSYMQGFIITQVKKDAKKELFIKVYNKELYSMIVEYGGRWTKHPKQMVLDHWINAMFAPKTVTELKQLVFLIGRAIKRNRYGGRGQRFKGSKRRGRVYTMNRAKKNSEEYLKTTLEQRVEKGLKRL